MSDGEFLYNLQCSKPNSNEEFRGQSFGDAKKEKLYKYVDLQLEI